MAEAGVHGHCDERFAAVRAVFTNNLASGLDVGASFAVTVEGETVVDLWGGWADENRSRAWQKDTIVNVYSTTKTMTALTALLLADRGVLDLHAPVARYWPEFAANGKEGVKVSQLLSHSAGLSGWDAKLKPEDLYDWNRICGLLAAQEPWWTPGEKVGYHAISQGFLVGEVIRRASGKTVGTVFREEIAGPLGADFDRCDRMQQVVIAAIRPKRWKLQHMQTGIDQICGSVHATGIANFSTFTGNGGAQCTHRARLDSQRDTKVNDGPSE